MGILDSIVEWIATQVMNLLDLITGSVLGALGCDMSTFLRYFPAAETLYEVFVAIGVGFILLNLGSYSGILGLAWALVRRIQPSSQSNQFSLSFWHCMRIRSWFLSWVSRERRMTGW